MTYSRAGRLSISLLLAIPALTCGRAALVTPPPSPPLLEPERVILDAPAITALAELLQAEDRRMLDSTRIAMLLANPLPQVRERAALAAGRIADPRATLLLLRALDDSAQAVGAGAAFALGQLRDTSATVVYTLARKIGGTWSEEDERGVEAVASLGRIGTPAAHAALRQVLQRYLPAAIGSEANGDTVALPMGHVGWEALLAIWRVPRPETWIDLVMPHLTSANDEIRWRATYAASRAPSPQAVSHLRERLADVSPLVRALAARGLHAPVVDSAGLRAQVTPLLEAALADAQAHVRINAAGALGTYADSTLAPALRDALAAAADDANVRIAIAGALGATPGSRATEALSALAGDAREPIGVRAAALAALARQSPRHGLDEASRWAAAEDWLTRLYGARAFGGLSWADAGSAVRELVEDSDPRVAAAALRAVTAASDTFSAPYALYIQALASSDVGVRAAAADGLARRGSSPDLPLLMQAYDRAQRDTVNDAALSALDALAALQRKGVPVSRGFFLRFSESADPEVRARVAQHFGVDRWGEGGRSPERGLDFYEDVVRELVAPDLASGRRPQATIRTRAGTIVIELVAGDAPLTVRNFITLATNGYFPGAGSSGEPHFRWHRVVPNFVLQDGDPRGDGSGGPGYAIRDEINRLRYTRGAVGMALSGPDTGGSQYFITHSPQPHLDGGYTIFGRVVSGMDIADRVVQDDPIYSIEISR